MDLIPPPDDQPEAAAPKPPRRRLWARRWRLWWRYQWRALPHRPGLRRVRLLREPGQPVLLGGAQLWIGRRLGSLYLWLARTRERLRIMRARVPDQLDPARTAQALLARQARLLVALAALISLGWLLDWALRAWGPEVASFFGIEDWLRDHFARPSDETLRNLLAVAAAGTATVLGLILSISLIVWQTTAERYRSTSIVGFLLRERVGSAVVNLLALGFAYALWVLALMEVLDTARPYVSAGIALLLCTFAVLSLLTYRQSGLLAYLPGNIAATLSGEIARERARARRPGAGPSVEDYSRRVTSADLQIFRDLIRRLIEQQDADDLVRAIESLREVIVGHLLSKPRMGRESRFFERRPEQLPTSSVDMTERLAAQGLMNPTTEVPDHQWLEREVLTLVRLVVDSPVIARAPVAEAVITLWLHALQYAWRIEDLEAAELILADAERYLRDGLWAADGGLAELIATLPWVLVELAGDGYAIDAAAIVAAQPWRDEAKLGDFPWTARADAEQLGRQVRHEIAITDRIITPQARLVEEVAQRRAARLADQRQRLLGRAIALCQAQLGVALANGSPDALARTARMSVRALLRTSHHELALPALDEIPQLLLTAGDRLQAEGKDELREETARAARIFAEAQEWEAADELLRVSLVLSMVQRMEPAEDLRNFWLLLDGLMTMSIVWAWGEFHQRRQPLLQFARFLGHPFADLDFLARELEERSLLSYLNQIRYHEWEQPLRLAANRLPDRHVGNGIGYHTVKAHPSRLFRRSELLFGPRECLEHLIEAVVAYRQAERERVVRVLRAVLEAKS